MGLSYNKTRGLISWFLLKKGYIFCIIVLGDFYEAVFRFM